MHSVDSRVDIRLVEEEDRPVSRVRRTAAVWGPVAFAAATIRAARLQPGYSHRSHHISGLAASGQRSARVMVPGFVMLAAANLAMPMRTPRLTGLARTAGVGVLTAGLVRASAPHCPRPGFDEEATPADVVHTIASVATFAIWTSMPLVAATGNGPRWFRASSGALAAASVVGLAAAGATTQNNTPRRGAAQRAFLGTVFAWQALAAVDRVLDRSR